MTTLSITARAFAFRARLEEERAPQRPGHRLGGGVSPW